MKKLRLLTALLLALPFAALSATLDSGAAVPGARAAMEDVNGQYSCCYVLINGHWYCVPC